MKHWRFPYNIYVYCPLLARHNYLFKKYYNFEAFYTSSHGLLILNLHVRQGRFQSSWHLTSFYMTIIQADLLCAVCFIHNCVLLLGNINVLIHNVNTLISIPYVHFRGFNGIKFSSYEACGSYLELILYYVKWYNILQLFILYFFFKYYKIL